MEMSKNKSPYKKMSEKAYDLSRTEMCQKETINGILYTERNPA